MNPKRCALAIILAISAMFAFAEPQESKAKPLEEPKRDTRVEPTSWGQVRGRVYDSITGLPIKDTIIHGYTDNGFEEKGRSTGKSDALGEYKIQLILGRVSSNFDVGRALLSSPVGMLFGTATNTTKRIDVSRVALSVEAKGYKPFKGIVVARSTNASDFRIDVEPILLVPDSVEGMSVAAKGWNAIRITSMSVNPSIAKPKDKIQFEVKIQSSNLEFAKSTELAAYSDLWKGPKPLKLQSKLDSTGTALFTADYVVSGKEKNLANRVIFGVTKSSVDYDPNQTTKVIVVNIVPTGGNSDYATKRNAAIELLVSGKPTEARDAFSSLIRDGSSQKFDLQMTATLNLKYGNPLGAVEPFETLWKSNPKSQQAFEDYINALYEAKLYPEATAKGLEFIKGIKKNDLPRVVSAETLAILGLTLLQTKDLKAADRVNDQLLSYPESGTIPRVIELRSKLRLAEVELAHSANPDSAEALADFGRALLDLGRYEEAVAKLAASAKLDPNQVTIQRDIAWAALQMRGGEKPVVDSVKAVEQAKTQLGLLKGQQRSKDFFAWNQYGLLLFALSEELIEKGAPEAKSTRDKAIEAIREALTLGRVGAKTNPGYFSGYTYGYMSGSEVAVSGFAYPQANATFVLLDSLRRLRNHDDDQVALLNTSSALLDLGQINLAKKYCQKLLAIDSNNLEATFIFGLISRQLDNIEDAKLYLSKALSIAPNHPRANLVLADILTELGDTIGASERIGMHAKYYGEKARQ